jgi:hypothetical protein
VEQSSEPITPRLAKLAIGRSGECIGQVVVRIQDELCQELVAVGEVAVKGRSRDAELPGNGVDRHRARAAGRDLAQRRSLYLLANLLTKP